MWSDPNFKGMNRKFLTFYFSFSVKNIAPVVPHNCQQVGCCQQESTSGSDFFMGIISMLAFIVQHCKHKNNTIHNHGRFDWSSTVLPMNACKNPLLLLQTFTLQPHSCLCHVTAQNCCTLTLMSTINLLAHQI